MVRDKAELRRPFGDGVNAAAPCQIGIWYLVFCIRYQQKNNTRYIILHTKYYYVAGPGFEPGTFWL